MRAVGRRAVRRRMVVVEYGYRGSGRGIQKILVGEIGIGIGLIGVSRKDGRYREGINGSTSLSNPLEVGYILI